MTRKEAAIITARTGIVFGDDWNYLYEYLSDLEGRMIALREVNDIMQKHNKKIEKDYQLLIGGLF